MSQENVKIVRGSVGAYNRRDIDGMLENHWASDAVLDWSNARAFDGGVDRGHGEIRAWMEGFLANWDEFGSSSSLARWRSRTVFWSRIAYGRGRDGIEVQARSAWLITIRDGRQISFTLYQTKQGALEAAGRSE